MPILDAVTHPYPWSMPVAAARVRSALLAGIVCVVFGGGTAARAAPLPAGQSVIPAPSNFAAAPAGSMPRATTAATTGVEPPPASEQWLDQQVASYRNEVQARVARGDMNPDEAERLIGWRRWQLSQQAAGNAPAPTIVARQNAADRAVVLPAPRSYYYAPGYLPYYAPGYAPGYAP
ncbi:MAG: hypothetical protein ABI881_16030, partial [Betaproteobacteria bacterium]